MVIAVWTVLVALVKLLHVLAERLLALLAQERHLHGLPEPMVLCLSVTLGAVKPLLAARRANGDLGVEDVFTMWRKQLSSHSRYDSEVCAPGRTTTYHMTDDGYWDHRDTRERQGKASAFGRVWSASLGMLIG